MRDEYGLQLFAELRTTVLDAWAPGTHTTYRYAWGLFETWCQARTPPPPALPASEVVVGMYLAHLLRSANSYSVVRTASAAIYQMHTANLHPSPCSGPIPRMVRKTARKRLGLDPKNAKNPLPWADVGAFAARFCRRDSPLIHWSIALMGAICFAGFARPSEPANLRWKHIKFETNHVIVTFHRRKNKIYREFRVRIANVQGPCCPASLLRTWCSMRNGLANPEAPVFPGFDGRRVQSHGATRTPLGTGCITYAQFRRYFTKWLAPLMNMTETAFTAKFGMQSGRSGGGTAAARHNIPFELWGAHGGWQSREAQMRYMELDLDQALSVTRAALSGPLTTFARGSTPDTSSSDSDSD